MVMHIFMMTFMAGISNWRMLLASAESSGIVLRGDDPGIFIFAAPCKPGKHLSFELVHSKYETVTLNNAVGMIQICCFAFYTTQAKCINMSIAGAQSEMLVSDTGLE